MDKPTVQQVQEYADSIGFDLDAEYFIAKNDAIGWMVGSKKNAKPAVSWKGIVRTWHIAAKRRFKQAYSDAEALPKKLFRPCHEPTVFVQCVKGPATGRYMPIVFGGPHQEDLPNEQYIAAAERMCIELNQPDGVEWVIRSDVDERTLILERCAAASPLPKAKRKKKGPLGINKEVYEQIKEIKKSFHHPPPSTDGDGSTEGPS